MRTHTIPTARGLRQVSALCLGAANFGTATNASTSMAILDRFVAAGGTFIDTANNYNQWNGRGGESESQIGAWMWERGNRGDVVLGTKCGAQMTGDDPDADWEGLSAPAIRAAVHASLHRLGTDHIDLYYAHIDDRSVPITETIGTLGEFVTDGTLDAIGCSNIATWRIEQARAAAIAAGSTPYTVVQQEFTYLWPRPVPDRVSTASVETLDYLDQHPELVLTAYSPVLAGSYARPERPLPAHRGYAHPSAYQRFQVLREVAAAHDATPNQIALAWLLARPVPVIPIVGASSVAQLDEALGALDIKLDDEVLARLNAA